jgi:hypothetical protein
MSTDLELNLDALFLPAWAQQPANKNLYAKYEGREESRDDQRGGDRGRRPFQGDRPRPRGPGDQRGPRGPRSDQRGPRGDRGPGGPRPQQDRRGGRPLGRGGERRFDRGERPEPEALPEIEAQIRPDDSAVELLTREIKAKGRAYPLFGLAQIVLEKPERHSVNFKTKKNAEGAVVQPLFLCALDDTLWLSEDEAVGYVLSKHFNTFYQAERTQTDPPKGTYTFVAQCGMSGTILGPPNYHDYQNQLRKLHAERFARMPFDVFKSRVKIVKDEAVVKKWIDDQSWKTEYVCLNVPEAQKLQTREDVEKHFRATHMPNIISQVESKTVPGPASRIMPCRALQRMVRTKWQEQQRFPLEVATLLSQQFAPQGLHFFKVNKITHVSVARPSYLDLETTLVSDTAKNALLYIQAHPKCTRRQLFEALVPGAVAAIQPGAENAPAPELPPEAINILDALHWLTRQGHVIEFANGTLEAARKPAPKPPPKAPAPERPKTAAGAPAEGTPVATAPEGAAEPVAESAPAENAPAPAENAVSPAETASAPAETQPVEETPPANTPS